MLYKCPHCGHPKLCGRRYKEGFFGSRLVDNPFSDHCYNCGTKWDAVAKVSSGNNVEYERVEFSDIQYKQEDLTLNSIPPFILDYTNLFHANRTKEMDDAITLLIPAIREAMKSYDIILTSSPKGVNHFYLEWKKSIDAQRQLTDCTVRSILPAERAKPITEGD